MAFIPSRAESMFILRLNNSILSFRNVIFDFIDVVKNIFVVARRIS